jgi:hypothetical protein
MPVNKKNPLATLLDACKAELSRPVKNIFKYAKSYLDNRTFVLLCLCASGRIDSSKARKTCHCHQPNTGHATRKTRIITTV